MVREKFTDLLAGRLSPEQIHDWAATWVVAFDGGVRDTVVWDALLALIGADSEVAVDEYLYSEVDYHHWFDDFENACERNPISGT